MGFQRPTSNWLAGFLPSTVRPFFACWVQKRNSTPGAHGKRFSEENSPHGLAIQSYPAVFWDAMAVDLPGSKTRCRVKLCVCWICSKFRMSWMSSGHRWYNSNMLSSEYQNWVCQEYSSSLCKSMMKMTKNEDLQIDLLPLTGGDSWRLLQFPEHCGNFGPETENWFQKTEKCEQFRVFWIACQDIQ